MTAEEKLILLAELMGVSLKTTKEERKKKFFSSDILLKLKEYFRTEKERNSPRYTLLKAEYDVLLHMVFDSEKKYFISYARALYLWNGIQNQRYINPFLCFKQKENILLSRVPIKFDGQEMFLGDVIMLENYSNDYKIDAIKRAMISWKKEVQKVMIDPLELLTVRPKNLPHKKRVPFAKKIYGIFLLLASVFLFSLFFLKDDIISPIFSFNFAYPYFSFPFLAIYAFVFFADFLWMISIARREYHMRKYFWAQDILFHNPKKIMDKIYRINEKLYQKILLCVQKKTELHGNLKPYSILDDEFYALQYMVKINDKDPLQEDTLFSYEGVFCELIILLMIYLIVCYVLIRGGFLK